MTFLDTKNRRESNADNYPIGLTEEDQSSQSLQQGATTKNQTNIKPNKETKPNNNNTSSYLIWRTAQLKTNPVKSPHRNGPVQLKTWSQPTIYISCKNV